MTEFQGLSEENLQSLDEIRARIHESAKAIIAMGDGGWNHGAKLMRSHAEALHQLKSTEALLVEGSVGDKA